MAWKPLDALDIRIFADGAELAEIVRHSLNPIIKGFTTNPTLMRQAGIRDYESFARTLIELVPDKPISFEVFSDDFETMSRQALEIASWGLNVFVKIPITNTKGETSIPLIRSLAAEGVKQNVTAMMTLRQVHKAAEALADGPNACLSIFAGRVADTGRDPVPLMAAAVELLKATPHLDLIWASPRELLNIFQADKIGCPIITVTHDLLKKLPIIGKDLDEYSLETVKMFRSDAVKTGYRLASDYPLEITRTSQTAIVSPR